MVRRQRHVGGSKRRQAANQRCDGSKQHGDDGGGSSRGMEMDIGWSRASKFRCSALLLLLRRCHRVQDMLRSICWLLLRWTVKQNPFSFPRRWISMRVMSCRDLAPYVHAKDARRGEGRELISTALRHSAGGACGWAGDTVYLHTNYKSP